MIVLAFVVLYWHALSTDFEANCRSPFAERRAASCEAGRLPAAVSPADDVRPLQAGILSGAFRVEGGRLVPPPADGLTDHVRAAQW